MADKNEPQSFVDKVQDWTEPSPASRISKLKKFVQGSLVIVSLLTVVPTIVAAVPTLRNVYLSWSWDVPLEMVPDQIRQRRLSLKNQNCPTKIEYVSQQVDGATASVGRCDFSGDFHFVFFDLNNNREYERWISSDELLGGYEALDLWNLLIPTAKAADDATTKKERGVRLAQAGNPVFKIQCQTELADQSIVRIVNRMGKCYRETRMPYKNRASKREEVSCDTKCPMPDEAGGASSGANAPS